MSTRPNLRPHPVIVDGDMSGNLTSQVTVLQSLTRFSYAITWADGNDIDGTVSVQVSNDFSLNPDGSVDNPGTWNTLTLAYNGSATTTVPVSGDSGNGFVDVEGTAAYAARLIYTWTDGVGTMQATLMAKVS